MSSLYVRSQSRSWSRGVGSLSAALACFLALDSADAAEIPDAPDERYQPLVFAGKVEPKFHYEVRALDEKGALISSFPVYAEEGLVLSGDTLRVDGAVALQTAVWSGDELIALSSPQDFYLDNVMELELPEALGYLLLQPVTLGVNVVELDKKLRRYDFELRDLKGELVSIDPERVQWTWPLGADVPPVIPKPPKCPGTACIFLPLQPKERLTPVLTACLGPLCAVNTTPSNPPAPTGWKSVAVGQGFSCGLTHQGQVWCWGGGINADLGHRPGAPCVLPPTAPFDAECRSVPRQIVQPTGSLGTFQALDVGDDHACAVDVAGDLWCWGELTFAEGGHCPAGTTTCHRGPFRLTPNDPAAPNRPAKLKAVSAGGRHTCGLTLGGSVVCFGGNQHGESGDRVPGRTYNAVGAAGRYASVSAGANHTCAVTTAGRVECWGHTQTLSSLPPQIPNAERFLGFPEDVMARHPGIAAGSADLVSAGQFRTCIHDSNGALSCIDELAIRQPRLESIAPVTTDLETSLIDGNTKCQIESGSLFCDLPGTLLHTHLPFSTPVVDTSVEFFHGCAVETDGTAWCWGTNDEGQLGNGTLDDADPSTPVAVLPPW